MKNLNQLTVKNITNQFNEAQLDDTGSLVPRNGLYYVREVTYRDVAKRGLIPIIIANWKANHYEPFLEEAVVEIALSSLHPAIPGIELDYVDLPGKTIDIFNMSKRLQIVNGKSQTTVQGKWMYDHRQPTFVSRTLLVLQLIASEMVKTQDGHTVITCDEYYGIDYEIEANGNNGFDLSSLDYDAEANGDTAYGDDNLSDLNEPEANEFEEGDNIN